MTAEKRAEPTPGPWTALKEAHSPTVVLTETKDDQQGQYHIATIHGQGGSTEANALLIAAAPDTAAERDRLEAANEVLQTVLVECEEYFDQRADADHNGVSFIANDEMRLLTEIRDILAKAKESTL